MINTIRAGKLMRAKETRVKKSALQTLKCQCVNQISTEHCEKGQTQEWAKDKKGKEERKVWKIGLKSARKY